MIWPIVILIVCLSFLLIVIIIATVQYGKMQKYTGAISNAWSPDSIDTDYAKVMEASPGTLGGERDDLILADFVVRMQHHEMEDITPPPDTQLLAAYGPDKGPYFVGVFLQGTNLVFAFRGTMTKQETRADLKTNQVPFLETLRVHDGFYRVYMKYRNALMQWILTPHTKIYLTGHSLGGAMANLMALDLVERANAQNVYAATFGAPRVGNENFAHHFGEHKDTLDIVRYANKADIITSLPLNVMPNFDDRAGDLYLYVHAGREVSFVENFDTWKNNHKMEYYIKYMKGEFT